MNDNDTLTREVRILKLENESLKSQLVLLGDMPPETIVQRYKQMAQQLEELEALNSSLS